MQVFLNIWAAVGPLLGVVVGALLTYSLGKRSQRKQWLADNRKVEFRQLLTAVNESFTTLLALNANKPFFHDDARERELLLAETLAARTIADRIFIADEVGKLKLMERWTSAARKFAEGKDIRMFGNEVNKFSEEIRQIAVREIAEL